MKRNTISFLVSLMLVFALVLTACPTSLGNDSGNGNGNGNGNGEDNGISDTDKAAVNKASLESAITAAEAEKALVTVSADGSDVAGGKDWVIQEVMDAFTAAITAAKTVKDSAAATQADVDAALGALNAARTTFQNTKAPGTKTSNFTMAELIELVTAAGDVKAGVVSSADGTDVPPSVQWVPTAVFTALETAISDAEAITEASNQSDRDAAYTALNIAKNNFTAAKSNGTKVVALSGKTYFERYSKIVFSVTATSSGTFTALEAEYEDGVGYILTNGKYTYGEASKTGTYTVNEGSSTVTLTPLEVRLSIVGEPSVMVNEAQYATSTRTALEAYRDSVGQAAFNTALAQMGFSGSNALTDFINYSKSQDFAVRSMVYSFNSDGALFLSENLPAFSLPDGLNGKILTGISNSSQTVEFSSGSSYTRKNNGSPYETGTYSLSSNHEYSAVTNNGEIIEGGFKDVNLKPETRNGNDRAAYYAALSFSDADGYESIIDRKAAMTNGNFRVYQLGYKLDGLKMYN